MKKRVWLLAMLVVLGLMAVTVGPKKVLAAGKTYYSVNAQNISQFKKSGNRLVIKADKNTIWKAAKNPCKAPYNSGKKVKNKKSLSLKFAKKCKWSWRAMGAKRTSIKYSELKKRISSERKAYTKYKKKGWAEEYETYFTITLTVEKGKITEVTAR